MVLYVDDDDDDEYVYNNVSIICIVLVICNVYTKWIEEWVYDHDTIYHHKP